MSNVFFQRKRTIFRLDKPHRLDYLCAKTFKTKSYGKRKVNYQEVYDLYQLCSEVKWLKEFCAEMGVNYDKFMNRQRHQLWGEKLGKSVTREQPQ